MKVLKLGRWMLAMCAAVMALPVAAQNDAASYPSRSIRILVPFSPGGLGDTLARTIGQHLGDRLGQSVVIENRPGASQLLAAEATRSAAPDGYTLMLGSQGGLVLNTIARKNLPYDPVTDFAPISTVVTSPLYLVTHPDVPATSVPELIALAQKQPGKLTYASLGDGSAMHIAGELFKSGANVDILHVPYRGSGGAIIDVVSGRVDMMFEGAVSSMPHVKKGALRLLATTGPERVKTLDGVPTVGEAVEGYNLEVWFALVAPAGTPQAVTERLSREVNEILKLPEMRKVADSMGVEPTPSTPQELGERLRKEVAEAKNIAKAAGIVAQ